MIPIKKRASRKPRAPRPRPYYGGGFGAGGFGGTVHGISTCKYCNMAIYAGISLEDH